MTISLDAEQTKKFRQRLIELKPSTLRTSDEISSFSKLQEISPLKLSCHDLFFAKMCNRRQTFTFPGRYLLIHSERRNFVRGSSSWSLQLYEPLMEFLRSLCIKRYRPGNEFFRMFYIFAKKNHDRKVSRAISLATKRTKKFHQRFIELKATTLWTSDEISSFSQLQEKSSPGKIFLTKILENSKLWHRI